MRQLIISDYDCCTDFTFIILEDGKEIKRGKENELEAYGLLEDGMFDTDLIKSSNKLIKQFDTIVVCENGTIQVIYPKEFKELEERTLQLLSIKDFKTKEVTGYVYEGKYQTEITTSLSSQHKPRVGDFVRDTETGTVYEIDGLNVEPIYKLNGEINPYLESITLFVNTKHIPKKVKPNENTQSK